MKTFLTILLLSLSWAVAGQNNECAEMVYTQEGNGIVQKSVSITSGISTFVLWSKKEKGKVKFNLSAEIYDDFSISALKGLIVVFSDNTEFSKILTPIVKEKNTSTNSTFKYLYQIGIDLTPAEADLFSKKTIRSFKLSAIPGDIESTDFEKFKCGVAALLASK